jgi:anti-sigma factor RsiW
MINCMRVRQSLGVYIVGAIDPAERSVVDRHLAGCLDCREELAGLAGLPALLGRVPIEEAEQIARSDASERTLPGGYPDGEHLDEEILTPLLARAAHRRRVSRWRNLASVAAVALIAAGAAVGAVKLANPPSGGSAAAVRWENVQTTSAHNHMDVRYAGVPWGLRLDVKVSGIRAGTTCELWVVGQDGQRWPAGGWTVTNEWKPSSYQASSAAPVGAVRAFQLTSDGRVLANVPAT